MEKLEQYSGQLTEMAIEYAPKLALAILTFIVGLLIINSLIRLLKKVLSSDKFDDSLGSFLGSVIGVLLKAVLIISVASMVGIETTSFVAILGAAGLAVGLALQGSLSNFAGGVLILIFRPIKVGDFISAQGHAGSVKEIQIFNTILKTPDNKTIIIPNGSLANGSITNFSTEQQRRVDMVFGIGYDDDFEKAKGILAKMVEADNRILKDPEPFIRVSELADSSVNITMRLWAESKDYWDIYFDFHENVKKEFDAAGISIPYPQRDVHLFNEK